MGYGKLNVLCKSYYKIIKLELKYFIRQKFFFRKYYKIEEKEDIIFFFYLILNF